VVTICKAATTIHAAGPTAARPAAASIPSFGISAADPHRRLRAHPAQLAQLLLEPLELGAGRGTTAQLDVGAHPHAVEVTEHLLELLDAAGRLRGVEPRADHHPGLTLEADKVPLESEDVALGLVAVQPRFRDDRARVERVAGHQSSAADR
jgi:hypothetical protein